MLCPAECHKTWFAVVAPPVLALQHRSLEDGDRVEEIEAVLAQIGLALGGVPFECFRTVYTQRIHVKAGRAADLGSTEKGEIRMGPGGG